MLYINYTFTRNLFFYEIKKKNNGSNQNPYYDAAIN